ncbi:MAG: ABC transporter substrate-binding protein [Phreatobacter sp.]|uniref:ABC transporter substrate-binding protein n=1 Tax=Phreatobacter sp. TaxID=1966341 RepID=UPI001A50A4C8|nr:ABC transporter substrate-binding protein [Phreatobacter sp.]MBL8569582.1 ABC transporter substrate-binding protein [Phreatobacter sp.]
MKKFALFLAASAALLMAPGAASAQHRIKIGCTATSDCSSAMIAVDQGIFRRHGIEAEMVLIGINSNIPAALLSNSIQIGGPTSSVFLQAADGGLPIVAVAGASVMSPVTNPVVAAFVRNGLTLSKPADFVGRKVGAPGFGAYLHVLFVKWLMEGGVDPARVNFVEVSFPTMADVVRSQAVDVVLAGEPTVARMVQAGVGTVGARYVAELNRTDPIIFYAAARAWATQNPQAVAAFRAAIREAAEIANTDDAKATQSIANFTKQQIELVRSVPRSRQQPALVANDLRWWIEVMKQQKLLQGTPNPEPLILP